MELSGEELAAIGAIWKREAREVTASFSGISMLPSIEPGAPLAIVCGDMADAGDVILFLHRGQPVVHRLLWISRDGRTLFTRGDANPIPDLPVPRDALIGRVTSSVKAHQESMEQLLARKMVEAFPSRMVVRLLWLLISAKAKLRQAWRLYGTPALFARISGRRRP